MEFDETIDAVRPRHAVERAPTFEIMQMRQRLAKRERHLMLIQRPAKQHRQQIDRAAGPVEGGDQLLAARLMMRRELVDTRMQSKKRQIMRRQH